MFGNYYTSTEFGDITTSTRDNASKCYGVYYIKLVITAGCSDGIGKPPRPMCIYIETDISKSCECNFNLSDSGQPEYRLPGIQIDPNDGGLEGIMDTYTMWLVEEEDGPPCPDWDCKCDWGGQTQNYSNFQKMRNPVYNTPPEHLGTPEEVYQEAIENYVNNQLLRAQNGHTSQDGTVIPRSFKHCCESI